MFKKSYKTIIDFSFIKNYSIIVLPLLVATSIFSGCGGGGSESSSTDPDIKVGYLTDARVLGARYKQGSVTGYTDSNGSFTYDATNSAPIDFYIGGITLGSVSPSSLDENNSKVYPADLAGVDRNETNNTKVTNILQVLQSLDDDGNPFNGIEISSTTTEALQNVSLSLDSNETNQSSLENIVKSVDVNKTLIKVSDAIAHYEDTLRKDLNLTIDTVAPAPAIIKQVTPYTNQDSKNLVIYGEDKAKIWINGVINDSVIGSNNQVNVTFNTSGVDGDKNFTIILQDNSDKNSTESNVTIIKDSTAPSLSVGTSPVSFDENTPITTTIFSASATDTHSFSYGINGTDASHFNIDSTNGIVTFKASPDYETKQSYDFNITATDIVGNLATQTVKVNINHLNDIAPVFTTNALLAVEENNATITTLSSTDADIDETQILTYSIVGGADSDQVQLSGVNLSFNVAPDFDNPTDANVDNQYVVDINVSDGVNSTTKTFTIAVTPANDNAPILVGATNTMSFNENLVGTVLDLNHTDVDSAKPGMVQVFTYSISGTDASYFNINSSTGVITFKASPDYETKKSYSITAKINDGKWDSAIANITINILPLNDIAPVITSANSVTFNENATGTVLTLTSSDADQNQTQTFTYSIAGTDAGLFDLNSSTGVLRFKQAPDYETKKSYSITASVSDGENTSTAQNIVITVGHLNDVAPIITSNDVSLGENIMNVMTVTSTDGDLDENQTFTYSIDGGVDASKFAITTDGNLTFVNAPDYEIPTDDNNDSIYVVGVKVFDGINTSAIKTLNITVTPLNDIAPIIISQDASINENNKTIITITSTDADKNQPQTFTYSLDGGADVDDFNITSNGVLTFKNNPDYEIPVDSDTNNIYIVGVKVSDGVNTSITKMLNISVLPLNDIAPILTSETSKSVNENTTGTVLTLTSTDGDKNQTQTFKYILSGTDANLFNLNISTGAISFKTAPNYDLRQTPYKFSAKVNDGLFDSVEQNITISINHLNDEAPQITAIDAVSINENTPVSTVVIRATATDGDIGETQTITYTLAGDDVELFNLNAQTGEITFKQIPDFENPKDSNHDNVFNLTIFASDGTNTGQASNLTIRLLNLNDVPAAPVFSNIVRGTVSYGKIAPNSLVILQDINKNIIQGYTDAYGQYSFNLNSNFVGPFIVKSYLPTGEILYSYNDGTKEVTNITPITSLIVKNFVINLNTTMDDLFTNFKTLYAANNTNFDVWINSSYTTVSGYFTTYLAGNNLTGFNHLYNTFYSYGFDYDRLLASLNMYVSGDTVVIRDSSNHIYTSTGTTIASSNMNVSGVVKDKNGGLVANASVVVTYNGSNYTVTTNSSGAYTISVPRFVNFDLAVTYSGYTINYYGLSTFTDLNDTTTTSIAVEEAQFVDYSDTSLKSITGTLVNTANTTIVVSGANVKVREGYNNYTGTVISSATTSSNGTFALSLKNGNYTFEYSKPNYTTKYISVYVNSAKTLATNDIQLISDAANISMVSVALATSSDTGISQTDNYTNDVTPTIITDQDAHLLLKNGSFQTIEDINVTSNDHSYTLKELNDGTYSIVGTNSFGLATGFNLLTFTIDTATQKPTINLHSSSDTGVSSTDNITKDSSPQITGLAEKDGTIVIKNGTSEIKTTTSNSSGDFSTYLYGLVDGNYSLTITSTDKAGNIATSDILDIKIDTVGAPLTQIDMLNDSDSGKYNWDNYTNDNTPSFATDQDVILELRKDGNSSVIQTINARSGYTVTLNELSDGSYRLSSGDENNNTDTAGNTLNYSYLNFTIDTVAITPTIDLSSDYGTSSIDNITNDTTPSFTYTKESNTDVVMKDAGAQIAWSYDWWSSYINLNNLNDGNHTITMTTTDLAGNTATSSPLEIEIDTVGVEAATITVEVDGGKGYDVYRHLTNDSTPTIYLNKNQQIRVLDGSTVVQTLNVTVQDDKRYAVTLGALTTGKTYTIETGVSGTDTAGNTLGYSSILLTIDTTISIATISLDTTSDSGISSTDRITNDNTPTFKFSAEAGTIRIIQDGVQIHTQTSSYYDFNNVAYTITNALADGNYTFTLESTDLADNNITSSPLTIQIDTVGEPKYKIDINDSHSGASDGVSGSLIDIINDNLNKLPSKYTLNYSDLYSYYWYDAGNDMYDTGNMLYINSTLQYIWDKTNTTTDKQMTSGSYTFRTNPSSTALLINNFTGKTFQISGGLGADGYGYMSSGKLTTSNGLNAYYKKVYGAGDPSVNQLIITNSSNPNFTVSSTSTDADGFTLSNIDDGSFVAYLLFAGNYGYNYPIEIFEALANGISIPTTNDNTPLVFVDKNATLILKDINSTVLQMITTTYSDNNYTATLNELSDGIYSLETGNEGTDTAGNPLSFTKINFKVDTVISKPTLDLNSSSDSGMSETDNITNIKTPVIIGTGEVGAKIVIKDQKDVTRGTTYVSSDGNYSVTLTSLLDGNYTLKAIATDAATNTATSDTIEVQIDTFGDTTISLDLDTASDTGTSNTDNITGDNTPTINTDRNTTLTIKNSLGQVVQTAITNANRATLTTLADGNYTIEGGIDTNDTAGNYLSFGSFMIQIDTTAPTITSPAALDSNSTITATSLHVYNTASLDASGVTYTLSGTDSGRFIIDPKTGILTLSNIKDAGYTYHVTVTATDIVGNSSSQDITITPQVITPLNTSKMIASDGYQSQYFGKSVAVSGDYIVVGSSNQGTYVYKKQPNGSTKELAKLSGLSNNYVSSVAIDGNYIVVGATSASKAYLYKIVDDNNITQLGEVTTTSYKSQYGNDVAISGDYIVVGNYGYNNTYLFKRNSDDNITQIAQITTTDNKSTFGYSVDISGDYMVIGDYGYDSAYIFKRHSDTNITQIDKVTQISSNNNFGWDVAIDEKNIVVAAHYGYGYHYNKAYIYQINNSDKANMIATLSAKDNSYEFDFGYSVDISGDYIVIGDYQSYDSNWYSKGAVHLFKLDNESGVTEMKKLTAVDAQNSDYFGYSVAIDGGNIVSGAIYEDDKASNAGAVYLHDIFVNKPYIPTLKTSMSFEESDSIITYTIPDTINVDNTSISMTLSGVDENRFQLVNGIISSTAGLNYEVPTDSDTNNEYNLTLNIVDASSRTNSYDITIKITDIGYLKTAKLKASDAAYEDYFGNTITSDGNYTVVGAYYEDPNNKYNAGSVYVYKKQSDGTMTQLAKLSASDGSSDDYFGKSVAINGNYIVVGAYIDYTTSSYEGSAYVFKINSDDTISQIAKLKANDAAYNDQFGWSVAISGDYIAVGAPYDDPDYSNEGSTYIFKRYSDNNVTQIAKLSPDELYYNDYFGYSLSMSNNYLTVGSYGNNAAYVYKIVDDTNITMLKKLTGSYGYFGYDVAMDNDYIVVGDHYYDRAYVFTMQSDDNISQIAYLTTTGPSTFGYSVDIKGDTIAIGDYNYGASVFKINSDTNITETVKLREFNGVSGINFGTDVSISGNDILITAPYEDTSGAVYYFRKDQN